MDNKLLKLLIKRTCTSFLGFLLVLSCPGFCWSIDTCKMDPSSTCKCATPNGVIIDLKPLAVDGSLQQPLFSNVTGDDKARYSYKPCLPMKEPIDCKPDDPCCGVAACQSQGTKLYNLGGWNSPEPVFRGEPGMENFFLEYSHTEAETKRTTYVYLKCSSSEKRFTAHGELQDKKTFYTFTLETKHACTSKGLSVGSILLIVFFVLVIVYIVGGVIFLRFVRGARGVEQFPNYEFWTDFPGLLKDGATFVLRGCKTDTDQTYDRI